MYGGKLVLAVVPARGGSRGIPLKNLREVGGLTLVERAGQIACSLDDVDRAVVSTDHPDIAEAARRAKLEAPFVRPAELSGPRVSDHAVLLHALQTMDALDDVRYDVVLMLQPTSPLRLASDVTRALRRLVDADLDAVWTVSPTPLHHHPLKQLIIGEDQRLSYWDARGAAVVARQQLEPVYHRNGVAYAISRRCIVDQGAILGPRSEALVVDAPAISIDTEQDLVRADELLAKRGA